jgi:hypothetical protein
LKKIIHEPRDSQVKCKRHAWFLAADEHKEHRLMLIQYVGQPRAATKAHGHSKGSNNRPFVHTNKAVLNEAKSSSLKPAKCYKAICIDANAHGRSQVTDAPRNIKQLYNARACQVRNMRISHDEIYNISEMSKQLNNYCKSIGN